MVAKKLAGLKNALETAAKGKTQPQPTRATVSGEAKAAGSRNGRIHVGAWLPAEAKTSLRMIQVKTDRSLQDLITEALNDLFEKHDVPVIHADNS